MPGLIRIADVADEGGHSRLAFDLDALLDLIPDVGARLSWNIVGELDILARSSRPKGPVWKQLSRQWHDGEHNIAATWDQLVDFSKSVLQTSDGVFAGHHGGASFSITPIGHFPDHAIYEACEIVLVAHESSF